MKLYSNITVIFAIWTISILGIAFFGFNYFPHSNLFKYTFFQSFSNWDGNHFLSIATFGYQQNFQYAFFPLYPLAIHAFSQITANFLFSALLISVVTTFLSMQFLYKLLLQFFDKKMAEKVILGMLFFPTSFYFLTGYSEGLFFLLVVLTFYFLKQKRYLLVTLFAILASATRLVGLALILGVWVEVITTYGINRKNWIILFAPLGFLIYCFYLYQQTHDPFYFLVSELHWQRNISPPGVSFWETIKSLSQPGFINTHLNSFLDLVFAIFGVGLGIRTFRFLPISWAIYSFTSILIPIFTPSLSSIPRFLIPIFPIFVLIAFVKNKYLNLFYQIITLMLLSLFIVLFINGYWVA